MKVLVTLKRVVDPYLKIRLKPQGHGVDTQGLNMVINPFDDVALAQSIAWREQGVVTEVVVVSIGLEACQETLRLALAKGADRALLVQSEINGDCLNLAKILRVICEKEQPDLVLMGKQSTDSDNSQTPQMLAGLLNWPQATFASSITVQDQHLVVKREIDRGTETLTLPLPAVVSVDLRLMPPKVASLPPIMKARQKTITTIPVAELGLNLMPYQTVVTVLAPPPRSKGRQLRSVKELADLIQQGQ